MSERRRLGSGHGRPGLPASLICWDLALQVGMGPRLAFSIDHTTKCLLSDNMVTSYWSLSLHGSQRTQQFHLGLVSMEVSCLGPGLAWPGRGAQLLRNLCPPDPPNTATHGYVQFPWTRRQAKHTYITDNLGSMRACGNRHENPGLLTKPYSGWSALGRIRLCALGRIRM